ncbi:unnamed protein product, partial [Meganyctiphanes norvegica]
MSSSFVKDCSDVSAGGNTNYIIIVDSETGNVALDGDSIQNLLGKIYSSNLKNQHVYDSVSAVLSIVVGVGADALFLDLPSDLGDGSSENYAELPLDADAFQRLESVLESEEAREILGEPLLNMVTDHDNLESLDQLLDPNILAGDSLNENVNEGDSITKKGSEASGVNNTKVARRSQPMRRSQRQQDIATKEEVEKILAENQRLFKEEKDNMKQKNLPTQKNEHEEEAENEEKIENERIEENTESREEQPSIRRTRGLGLGQDSDMRSEEVPSNVVANPRGGRGRSRGSVKNTLLEKKVEAEPSVTKDRPLGGAKNNAKLMEIEEEPIVARGRVTRRNKIEKEGDEKQNKTDKEENEKPAIFVRLEKGRGVNNKEVMLPVVEQTGRGKGRGRVKKADILVKPVMKNQKVIDEKIGVVELKDIAEEKFKQDENEEVKMSEGKICETNILLTSKSLPELKSNNSSQDIAKEDGKVHSSQLKRANNHKTSEILTETEEVEHEKVSKEECDDTVYKKEENVRNLEDKEEKKEIISLSKDNRKDMAEETVKEGICEENIIENKEKLQAIEEDSEDDISKEVENIKKNNDQPSTRSRVLQVKNITEVKQVVMLNSVTSLRSERGIRAEPLVKIIPPIIPPPEEKSEKERRKTVKNIVQLTNKTSLPPKREPQKRATTTLKAQTSPVRSVVVNPTVEESPSTVRRSGRAIKKKTFGDEMVTFDDKDVIDVEDEADLKDSEEESTEEEEEDDEDPERLWCICQKPHNNRFMICCDKCEDWFHGSCVGITKAMGQQMENESQEWVCPKCKKAERALKGPLAYPTKVSVSELSPGKIKEEKIAKPTDTKPNIIQKGEVKAKKEENTSSTLTTTGTPGKSEPRVLVYEKMTGKVLTGSMAPTLDHLKVWLKEHPDYAVLQPGMMGKTVSSVTKTGGTAIKLMDGSASKTGTAIKLMDGSASKTTNMKVSPTGPSQVKAVAAAAPSQTVSNLPSSRTITTTDVDSTAIADQHIH